jgi:hypothetical protein
VQYRENVLIGRLERLWEIYDAAPKYAQKNWPWENASNLSIALGATYVDQFVAKHVNALRSPTPFLSLSSKVPENADSVQALSDYLDLAEKSLWKGQQLVENFERDRCKVGTGVGYVGFVDIPYLVRRDITSGPAEPQGRIKHPDAKWIPREDFLITPGYDDLDKAPLVGHRSWLARSYLQRLAYENQIDIDFDKVKPTNKNQDEDVRVEEDVTPYEIFFISFCYDLDGDNYPEEYEGIFHFESKQLLYYAPNTRAYGKRPYFSAPFVRREGEFDGLGICEQAEHYQSEVSTIHNQRRDNATIANNVMLKGRPVNGINESTRWYPGKIWLVNDINDLDVLDLPRSYMSTVQDESLTISLLERRIGISDAAIGRESTLTNRAAATTTMFLAEQGAQRDDLSVTLGRDAFQRYGELLLEAFQQNGLPDPDAATSPESMLGQERGGMVRSLFERSDTILGLVGVTIEVSTRAINKEMRRQANERLYGLIIQHAMEITKMLGVVYNPQTPPPVKEFFINVIQAAEKVLKDIVESTDAYDLNSMFISDDIASSMAGGMNGNESAAMGGAAPANGAPLPGGPQQGALLQ